MTHSGGKPHAVNGRRRTAAIAMTDVGQRYEVKFKTGGGLTAKEGVAGYSESYTGAQAMERAVNGHPTWHTPVIVDRIPGGRK